MPSAPSFTPTPRFPVFLHGGDSERLQRHAGARIARGANRDDEARKGSSGGSDAANSDWPANMR